MTRRVLTAMGSATAVAATVGTCLLLGPTPQAQADISGTSPSGSGSITTSNGTTTVTGRSSNGTATLKFGPGLFCVMGSSSSGFASLGNCK